ncbi:MAG: tetratricopeptide (TPR) repeat protein, partial [Cognaticolwellia sp.]
DAARVCVGLVRVNAGHDMSAAEKWGDRAVALHGQFSDPLGPAHVALAMGLGLAEAKKMDEALVQFATAVELGRASDRRQGAFIADTAQRNAAQALAMLGASPEAAALAASQGLEVATAHHGALSTALQEYEQGLQAYREGRYVDAQRRFESSGTRLEGLGEAAYAVQAEKALLWATYNVAVSLDPSESLVFWAEILADAQRLDEQELEVRARAEQAVSLAQMGQPKADAALKKAAEKAEKSGYPRVAARCYAELAELPGALPERAAWAQKAFALQPKAKGSVYAMYVVAVDAYNADELQLARRLAEQALPEAGELQEPLQGVIDATR